MARIKISVPDKVLFQLTYNVSVSDLNYGNHLANDKVLSIAHESRMRWLKSIDSSELNLFGVSLIQGDAAIVYQSEGFYGDEIQIEIRAGEVFNSGFELIYLMKNITTQKDLAMVKTGMVCFDYGSRKVQPIPELLSEILK